MSFENEVLTCCLDSFIGFCVVVVTGVGRCVFSCVVVPAWVVGVWFSSEMEDFEGLKKD